MFWMFTVSWKCLPILGALWILRQLRSDSSLLNLPLDKEARLSPKRKAIIADFKLMDPQDGSPDWSTRLTKYFSVRDHGVTLEDVQRWMINNPWISQRDPPLWDLKILRSETNASPGSPVVSHSPAEYPPSEPDEEHSTVGNAPYNPEQLNERSRVSQDYQQAFEAISVLNDVCSRNPQVLSSLIPLEEINRNFVRSFAKFICPNRYRDVRKEHPPPPPLKFESSQATPSSEQVDIDVADDSVVEVVMGF